MNKRLCGEVISVSLAVFGLLASSCSPSLDGNQGGRPEAPKQTKEYIIPPKSEIKKITAKSYNSLEMLPDIPEFIVLPKYQSEILKWFNNSTMLKDNPPPSRECIGELRVTSTDGKLFHIRFFWTGKNPVVFTLDGKKFFLGDTSPYLDGGLSADHAIRKAYSDSKKRSQK